MSAVMAEQEWEVLPELQGEGEFESAHAELESASALELENGEQFLGSIANWARNQWTQVQAPGTWQRKAALAAAKSALPAAGGYIGTRVGGLVGPAGVPIGGILGGALGAAGASLLPNQEFEAEFEGELEGESYGESEAEFEGEGELNPVRKIYLDAMLEHMAHEAALAESEQEAAEGFLPLIPMLAGKLLPLAAKKILPRLASRALPRIARAVTRASPQLSRGVSNITRTLYRNRRTRPLVRTVPTIATRTINTIARQAAAGRPVSPALAQRLLAQQTYRVLTQPQVTARVLRRNGILDTRYHRNTGTVLTPGRRAFARCPSCGFALGRRAAPTATCSCSCN